MVFRGINNVALDAKGRIAIPTRYRQRLMEACTGKCIVTIDTQERCLLIYPIPAWEIIERQLEALPSFNQAARKVQRLLIGYATETDMDGQGRMLLSHLLRDYAQLTRQTVLVGQGNKFELWDEAHWLKQTKLWLAEANEPGDLPEKLKDLSI